MSKLALVFGACGGFLSVAFGAFGTHALRERLDAYALGIFETAVQYQFFHSLALLFVALLLIQFPGPSPLLKTSVVCFVVGILVFSGSLYLLSFTGIRWLGAITPMGGLSFLLGWGCLIAAGLKLPSS